MKSVDSTAWLFTATSPAEIFGGYASINPNRDLVIAVDSGLERVQALGLKPDLIIGDMDSVEPELLQLYPNTRQLRHPADKNETDTELALLWCLNAKVREIVICNSLEGRFDHSLALVQNLEFLQTQGFPARIESAWQRIWFLSPETTIRACRGCQLSLLAWGGEAKFDDSSGLKYPLDGISLFPQKVRGMSNQVDKEEATIKLASGIILAILTKSC